MVEFAHKHYIGNSDGGGGMPSPAPTRSSSASKTMKKAAVKKSVKNK
jgi:hypothetical protein